MMSEEIREAFESFSQCCDAIKEALDEIAKQFSIYKPWLDEMAELGCEPIPQKPKFKPQKCLYNKSYRAPIKKPSITARSRLR